MRRDLEFILGLLDDRDPAELTREDFDGPHGRELECFRRMGFIGVEPGMNPCRSCPHCLAGSPYRVDGRYVCNLCRGEVDVSYLQHWRCDAGAFLGWFAREQRLQGGVERIDDGLWRLGTFRADEVVSECFYLRGHSCSEPARRRLDAFRTVLVLHGKAERPDLPGFDGRILSLLDALDQVGDTITVRPLGTLLSRGGTVSFDRRNGSLSAGDVLLGRIPPGTRQYHLIAYLADRPGETVSYADLKRLVCAETGSQDETEEATFCHKLKSRIKKAHGIAAIDRLLRTDRQAGGYVLRPTLSLEAG